MIAEQKLLDRIDDVYDAVAVIESMTKAKQHKLSVRDCNGEAHVVVDSLGVSFAELYVRLRERGMEGRTARVFMNGKQIAVID